MDSLGQQFLDLLDQASCAMWTWPDLCGCTGVAWDVTDFDAGAFFWTAGVAGTAGACFIWVAGVAGASDVGCMHGAGAGDAGCSTKKQGLACSVAGVPLGDSVVCLDTAFTEVSPCAAVCGTIAGTY